MRSLALTLFVLPAAVTAQSGWSTPVLEPVLNSTAADTGPHLSIDGTTLHFASFRNSNWEIYSATRPWAWMPWSAPVLETALGDPAAVDDQPFLAANGLELWLSSSRAGTAGSSDLMRATRLAPGLPWSPPAFVTEVNGASADSSPSLTADGLELYFLSTSWHAPTANANALVRATRPNVFAPFGTPALVNELFNTNTHRDAEISADGLSVVYTEFFSPRTRVLLATRTSRSLPFDPPVALAEFDTTGTSIGVFSFTRSQLGHEAILAAGFASAAGGQELMTSRFEGFTHTDIAGAGSTMTLAFRDSLNAGKLYAFGAALGNTGFPLGTRTVPLDPDFLLSATLAVNHPGFTTGWIGGLDPDGMGIGTLANPVPAFAGLVIHVGAFTFDPAAPFGVATISNSFAVQLH